MPLRHSARDVRRAPLAQPPLLFHAPSVRAVCRTHPLRCLRSGCCTIGARQKEPAGCNACGSLRTMRTGTVHTGTARTGTVRTGTVHTGTARTGTARTGTVRTGTVRTRTARTSTARTGIAHRSAPLSSGPQVLSDSLRSARHRYAPLRTAPEGIASCNFAPFALFFCESL